MSITEMELIPVHTENGNSTVLATHLYNFLEPKTEFRHWIKRMLDYGFVEGTDFATLINELTSKMTSKETVCRSKMTSKRGGHNAIDYVLTLDCAKAIAMVQRSEKGKLIRSYFIEVERQYKAIASPEQLLALQNRVSNLEARQIDFPNDWTVDRYLRLSGTSQVLTPAERVKLGKQCTKAYKTQFGQAPKSVHHPSYPNGQNVYPYQLINEVFAAWKGEVYR